ncbi:hypothetical protein H261_21231 [Paramagnetospirillum caucaseum]|uniref:PIN domain-containing protein n=1 Tax=Paramagnetospirillum caucaseum TaxID=1244869 RepID=M3A5X6_9PROT|nr:PIN domain-containing protein [Paramagnetospirillum caucaseum]EME67884.1 hypothetical protein H261_21231 [Paramagnetospirillum caucaseum]
MITFVDNQKYKGLDLSLEYLFDANVWISLNGPFVNPTSNRTILYSGIMKSIMVQGGQIFSDITIISEFINRYARLEFELAIKKGFSGNFKAFRKSPLWTRVAEDIRDEVKSIINIVEIASYTPVKSELTAICDKMAGGGADFNDEIIIEVCVKNGFVLVTHDADFATAKNFDIISGNPAYGSV